MPLRPRGAPRLVVDLGCGTGLSAAVWAARAERVVGVEPAPGMLAVARRRLAAPNLEVRQGPGHATGLPAGGADVVTAVQAFHYMDPEATLAEVARVLRPGGVFAAADYYGPVTSDWELEAADEHLYRTAPRLRQELGLPYPRPRRWPKEGHLECRAALRALPLRQGGAAAQRGGGRRRALRAPRPQLLGRRPGGAARPWGNRRGAGAHRPPRIAERVLGADGRWVLSWRVRLGVRA